MLEITDMTAEEKASLLQRVGYGHLGCSRYDKPYVIPVHYAYAPPDLYLYTTQGMKTELLNANPQVCLQVEEVESSSRWSSVIVTGYAERLHAAQELEHARKLLRLSNPDLLPATAKTQFGAYLFRSNTEVIYRIRVHHMTGRKTR
jgi:uncharacterized protein